MKYILLAFVVLVIIVGIIQTKAKNKWKKKFSEHCDMSTLLDLGKLVNGHPDIDLSIQYCCSFIVNNNIVLFDYIEKGMFKEPKKIGIIPINQISNIVAEDQSTMESRITATRLLLVGVFALAWKKKEKNELGYLTIFWNDGKFDHETIFEFEGKDAVQRANSVRNSLIKVVR